MYWFGCTCTTVSELVVDLFHSPVRQAPNTFLPIHRSLQPDMDFLLAVPATCSWSAEVRTVDVLAIAHRPCTVDCELMFHTFWAAATDMRGHQEVMD